MSNKIRVTFAGSGNLAWGLASALPAEHFEIVEAVSRTGDSAIPFAEHFKVPVHGTDFTQLSAEADLLIIAVPDSAIRAVSRLLPATLPGNPLVVHCSGATPLKAVRRQHPNVGVMWPLQTFTKGVQVDLSHTPIFIECADARLKAWASLVSDRVLEADTAARLRIHAGAVFVANFPNALYLLAEELLKAGGDVADLSVYHPLMREALEKAIEKSPREAQTGPARRHDEKTMKRHRELLGGESKELLKVYELLSGVIGKRY